MPSYRERVYLCPEETGQPVWVGPAPAWWDRRAFFEQYSERRLDTGHPLYVDYAILLTQPEALAWDWQCREQPADGVQSGSDATRQEWVARLRAARWAIVESYEWESGLE